MEVTRRDLFKGSAALILAASASRVVSAADDPLPSWNDSPSKKTILDFVNATTDRVSPKFVPEPERIATFDQDGTLWVEHPPYTQVVYCLDRVPAVVKDKPELANVEPFKTVLTGDREAIVKLPVPELMKVLAATLTGMSVDQFESQVEQVARRCPRPALEEEIHRPYLCPDARSTTFWDPRVTRHTL